MAEQEFTLHAHVDAPLEEAERRVRAALQAEGFGILTEIDVRRTLKEKINADFRPYRILGACNPPLAHMALTADARIGAVLPCNVVVADDGAGATDVFAFDPLVMLGLSDAPALHDLATDARARLERALATL